METVTDGFIYFSIYLAMELLRKIFAFDISQQFICLTILMYSEHCQTSKMVQFNILFYMLYITVYFSQKPPS